MIRIGQRRFNTTGPCFPNEHYMLDALARLPDVERLIASRLYFVLHAARQSGKTTAVKALAKKLNAAGEIAAGRLDLYVEFGKGRYAIEAKRRSRFNDTELKKTAKYLDSLGLDEGFMPVFDSDRLKSWDDRIWCETKIVDGKRIHCYGV